MRALQPMLLLVTGCVTVHKSVLMDRSGMPVPREDVYVFLSDDSIPETCERVALLHGSGDEEFTDEADMLDRFREEAGKLGANAVHLRGMEDPGTGERVASAILGTRSDRDGYAVALWCPDREGFKEGRRQVVR